MKTGAQDDGVFAMELYERFEIEFELDLPGDAEETLLTVRDVRDCIRRIYREQGIEAPSGAIFERLRRVTAVLTRADASDIEPATRFSDLLPAPRAA